LVQNAGDAHAAFNLPVERDMLTLFNSPQTWPNLAALSAQPRIFEQPHETRVQLAKITVCLSFSPLAQT